MQHTITDDTVRFIAQWEGFKSHAYYDETGHVWTIGYGHTSGVNKDMTCTKAKALEWLKTDASKVARYINSLDMNITQQQFDALVSFGFNVGVGNLKQSTLLKYAKHTAPAGNVMAEFYKWVHSGGKVLPGLVLRREGEAMLYGEGKYATRKEAEAHIVKRKGNDWQDVETITISNNNKKIE